MGDLLVVIGLAFYPNLGTAEAFAIVNHRGLHTTVRAHRKLGNDRMDMAIGPFSFEVVEPFRRWRLRLDADAAEAATGHRIGYDMSWLDTKRPVFRQLGAGIIVGARAMSPVAGYDGFGRQEGWVETAGGRVELSPATHLGTRDHHWGTRDGVGGPGRYMGMQHPHSGEWVEFEDFGIWGDHVLYNLGDARKRSATLRERVHRMRFEPDTNLLVSRRGRPGLRRRQQQDDAFRAAWPSDRVPSLRHVRRPQRGHARWRPVARHGGRPGRRGGGARRDLRRHRPRRAPPPGRPGPAPLPCQCDGEVAYGLVEPYDTLCYEVSKAGVMGFSLLDRTLSQPARAVRGCRIGTADARAASADHPDAASDARRMSPIGLSAAARVAGDALVAVVDGQGPHQGEDLVPVEVASPRCRSRAT